MMLNYFSGLIFSFHRFSITTTIYQPWHEYRAKEYRDKYSRAVCLSKRKKNLLSIKMLRYNGVCLWSVGSFISPHSHSSSIIELLCWLMDGYNIFNPATFFFQTNIDFFLFLFDTRKKRPTEPNSRLYTALQFLYIIRLRR